MIDWAICVGLHNWAMTRDALTDLLAQTGVAIRVLYLDQGSDDATRDEAKRWAAREPRLLVWCHDPPLPSLSASWNLALRFVWAQGGDVALVVNNDCRFPAGLYAALLQVQQQTHGLFVSAVGVREKDYDPTYQAVVEDLTAHGGPDFSCYLLTREGHEKYPFDEGFTPAYCEDLDLHRRYMLGGDGARIFSVNLPYLHFASGTLKAFSPEQRRAWEARIGQSRAYYARKWGGPVNQERYTIPHDPASAQDGVTTPELQAAGREA